jgi:hypothetical protein
LVGVPIGQTQRILPHAIVEKFETSSSGALALATENSTRPVNHARYARRHCDRNSIRSADALKVPYPRGVRMIRKRPRDPILRIADARMLAYFYPQLA